jgi:hypothetical protein
LWEVEVEMEVDVGGYEYEHDNTVLSCEHMKKFNQQLQQNSNCHRC